MVVRSMWSPCYSRVRNDLRDGIEDEPLIEIPELEVTDLVQVTIEIVAGSFHAALVFFFIDDGIKDASGVMAVDGLDVGTLGSVLAYVIQCPLDILRFHPRDMAGFWYLAVPEEGIGLA